MVELIKAEIREKVFSEALKSLEKCDTVEQVQKWKYKLIETIEKQIELFSKPKDIHTKLMYSEISAKQ